MSVQIDERWNKVKMVNFNFELGTIALPIMFFLFTKSLKQSITERILGEEDLTRSVLFRLDNLTSKELSQTMKGIFYEVEMSRINFCEKCKYYLDSNISI